MPKVALCYIRKSMVRTAADTVSPARQRANCIIEAERRGWVAEVYEDAEGHRSGRREKGRPSWLALKAQLNRTDVCAVIVESLSRASRSVKDLANIVEQLQVRDIALISLKENIDTQTAMGRAFVGFIAVMNQFESDIASERMTMMIDYTRTNHGRHWGTTPFGCARDARAHYALRPSKEGIYHIGETYIIGASDAPPFRADTLAEWRGYFGALVKCYEWYCEGGTGLTSLGERLNAAGYRYRDRNGNPRFFNKDDVRRMLEAHRLYAGFVIEGRAKDHAPVIRKANYDAILAVELCDRVAEMLESRNVYASTFRGRHSPGRLYLLGNLLYCAECGGKMSGYFQDGKMYYRHAFTKRGKCKGQVLADALDAQVMAQLGQFKMPIQLKDRIIFLARKLMQDADTRPDWKEARATLQRLARKLDNLKELRIEGEISKQEYERRKLEIEMQMTDARKRSEDAPTDVQDIEDLIPKIDRIADVIREGSVTHKKELFKTMFKRIEQRDGMITRIDVHEWAKPFFENEGND